MANDYLPYDGLVVTREDAKRSGLARFFMGKYNPCKKGHVSQRYTSSGGCVTCSVESRARFPVSPEMQRERNRIWREANPDYKRPTKSVNVYNPERLKAWKESNPESCRATRTNIRSKLRGASGKINGSDLRSIFTMQRGKCAYCRSGIQEKYEIDHVLPISRGGDNRPSNIALVCRPCNVEKGDKLLIEFVRDRAAKEIARQAV